MADEGMNMAAGDHLGMQQFKPIYETDLPDLATARSTSQPVSHQQFQAEAAAGQAKLSKWRSTSHPTPGIEGDSWNHMVDHAYQATREPWGGATYDGRTGSAVDFHYPDKLAMTVRNPDESPVSVHPLANRQQFGDAMDQARAQFGSRLGHSHHYMGVFHDADAGRIDIDPVVVAGDPSGKHREHVGVQTAKEVMSATHALGGAYQFSSGNGVFPNHVAE